MWAWTSWSRSARPAGPKKHEGILLADILGLATLVQLQDARHAVPLGGTEPALIGPFWREASRRARTASASLRRHARMRR